MSQIAEQVHNKFKVFAGHLEGYRDDEAGYPIKLSCVSLGKLNALGSDFSELEKKMQEASAQQRNIICHEL